MCISLLCMMFTGEVHPVLTESDDTATSDMNVFEFLPTWYEPASGEYRPGCADSFPTDDDSLNEACRHYGFE